MSKRWSSTSRAGALEATQHFSPDTVGSGVHQGIDLLYNGAVIPTLLGRDIVFGPLYDKYSADVGTLFQSPEMQELMSRPASDMDAQREVARRELEYWQGVLNDPTRSADDKTGARIAMALSEESRANSQKDFANGKNPFEVWAVLKEFVPNLSGSDAKKLFGEATYNTIMNRVAMFTDVADFISEAARSAVQVFDPLVLDLDGNGVELVSLNESTAQFDLDADGFREQTGWVSATDGILALDRNNDGIVNNITELFGDATTDGFEELALLDTNDDGVVDSQDINFSSLKIWQDSNQDGQTDAGELRSITASGVSSISLSTTLVNEINQGNQVQSTSTFSFSDGSQNEIASVWYAVDRVNTIYNEPYELDVRTAFLPTLRGYGQLPDLHISSSLDSELLDTVRESSSAVTADFSQIYSDTQSVLFAWAGAEGNDDASEPRIFDPRKSFFLEKLLQQPIETEFRTPVRASFVSQSWNLVAREMSVRLASQGSLREYFSNSFYDIDSNILSTEDSLEVILERLEASPPNLLSDALQYWSYAILILDAHEGFFGLTEEKYNERLNVTLSEQGLADSLSALRNPFYGDSSSEYLYGNVQDDLLLGNEGDDYLNGGRGADIYNYAFGDGSDIIDDSDSRSAVDRLFLSGGDAVPGNVVISRVEGTNDLLISFGSADGSVLLKDQIYGASYNYGIESVVFSDGSTWDETQLWGAYLGRGADTDDSLKGSYADDVLFGGHGDDLLSGSRGADTYRYTAGDGNDVIDDSDSRSAIDQLVFFGDGLTQDNVIVSRVETSNDLLITFGSSDGDSILLKDQIYGASYNYGIESVVFSDGSTWSEAQLWENAQMSM